MANKNVEWVRNDLLEIYEKLKNGREKHYVVKELVNAAGKVLTSAKLQLEYHAARREVPNIPFLNSSSS